MKTIRRVIYALLVLGTVGPPVRLLTVNRIETFYQVLLMQVCVLSMAGLAVWSAVCVRSEPVLARSASILLAIMIFATLWVHKL